MKTIAPRQDQGIPGVYALLLLDVISRWGYNDESLFKSFGLSTEQLADPDFRIPTPVANELVKHALKLSGEPTLGYHLGTQMRISIHGFIGYAIMTSKDITDALVLANRFIQLRMPFLQLFFSTFGAQDTDQLQTVTQLEPLRADISIALIFGRISMAQAIPGIDSAAAEIDFDFKKPEGFERFMAKFPHHQFRFEQPHLILSFDKSYLMNKLVHADPIASQIAINQCETELSALGERHRIAMRVRDILTHSEQHYLSIESV